MLMTKVDNKTAQALHNAMILQLKICPITKMSGFTHYPTNIWQIRHLIGSIPQEELKYYPSRLMNKLKALTIQSQGVL